MILYSLRLAFKNLGNRPGLTALTIGAIAIGLALLTTMTTMSYQSSKVPVYDKRHQLNTVLIDTREKEARVANRLWRVPYLTYQDTMNLYNDKSVDAEKTYLWKSSTFLNDIDGKVHPRQTRTMAGLSNFFTLFDVPFLYGSGWSKQDDESASPVIVLSYKMNQHFFNGEDSVGKTLRINSTTLTVIGVLADWKLASRFYDRSFSSQRFDDVFIPSSLAMNINIPRFIRCWSKDNSLRQSYALSDIDGLKTSECTWLALWVDLKEESTKKEYQAFIDRYVSQQKSMGRIPRDDKPQIVSIQEYLDAIITNNTTDSVFNLLAILFFLVCLLNTVGILLAKYMGKVPEIALRRALGAKKHVILQQYLLEVSMIAVIGGILGLILSHFSLIGMMHINIYQSDYTVTVEAIRHLYKLDLVMIAQAMGVAVGSALLVSLFPVWKICNTAPAGQLKSQ